MRVQAYDLCRNPTARRIGLVTVVTMLVSVAAWPARAVNVPPGPLDPGFGSGGIVTTDVGPAGTVDVALGMAMQPDGKLVLAGNSGGGASFGSGGSFALVRLASDGTLDPSFGGDGRVVTDVVAEEGRADEAHAVAIQPDGKIVAVGVGGTPDTFTDFAVVRYDVEGTLDESFGDGGIVLTDVSLEDFGTDFSNAWAVALQPDGKIVVAGELEYSAGFALARYLEDGSLDETFAGDGTVVTTFCSGDLCEPGAANAVVVQPDGRIVAAGIAQIDGGGDFTSYFALARYNPNGTLDPTFGTGGMVTTAFGKGFPSVGANALVLQPDGKLVAAGSALVNGQYNRFGLVRYNPNGTLDPTFGDGGKVMTSVSPIASSSSAQGLALFGDGRLMAVGSASNARTFEGGTYFHQDFAAARYNQDGSLDTSFSGDGKTSTEISDGYNDLARGVVIGSGGEMIVSGYADVGLTYYDFDFAVVRYREDLSAPDTVITKGVGGSTRERRPTFRFGSDEPGPTWYRCRVDSQRYRWCSSPRRLPRLSLGSHTFRVVALDEAGNPDPTPAVRRFKVVR